MSKTPTLRAGKWQNWSGSVRSAPREICMPASIDELAERVAAYSRAGRHMRVVGAGHSFTPLVQTDDVLISLDRMQGITAMDATQGTVTVLGGTRLYLLGRSLTRAGAGPGKSGRHQPAEHRWRDQYQHAWHRCQLWQPRHAGRGDHAGHSIGRRSSPAPLNSNPDIFKAARVAVGALGVIAAVTLRAVPAKRLHMQVRRERLSQCLEHVEEYKRDNTHFEYYWFPYTDGGQAKFLNATDDPPTTGNAWATFNKIVLENGALWVLSESCRLFPRLAPTVCKIEAQGITNTDEVNYSHRLYATPRAVRFQEMEYSIPAEHFTTVMGEIRERIAHAALSRQFPHRVPFCEGR